MNLDRVLCDLREAASLVEEAVEDVADWSRADHQPSQLRRELIADGVAVEYLLAAGYGVLSEARAPAHLERDVVVLLDPIDGTTNATRGVPAFGPSLCAFVRGRPVVAHVLNLATGDAFDAVRGGGACANGRAICASGQHQLSGARIATSGSPVPTELMAPRPIDAIALALCAVAAGAVDGFVDLDDHHHRCWEYAAGAFVCQEAGALVVDALDRPLWVLDPSAARAPVAAGTSGLLSDLRRLGRPAVPPVRSGRCEGSSATASTSPTGA